MGRKIDSLNYCYDFAARIVKGLGFIVLVLFLVLWLGAKWSYIDMDATKDAFIEKHTFIKLQKPEKATYHIATEKDFTNIYQDDRVVFTVDKPYDVTLKTFTIDKMVVKGKPNYKRLFSYAGVKVRIVRIRESIGLLITAGRGVEGPVLRGVDCVVEDE